MEFVELEWQSFQIFLNRVFYFIFPEFPEIGIIVLAASLLVFFFYLFKAGFSPAFRLSTTVFVIVTFVLFAVHHMGKLFKLNLLFS